MKEIMEKLIAEYGLEKRKDPFNGFCGTYFGHRVIYLLSLGLVDVLTESGRYYSCKSEEECRALLNSILPFLKKRHIEHKLNDIEKDFE